MLVANNNQYEDSVYAFFVVKYYIMYVEHVLYVLRKFVI